MRLVVALVAVAAVGVLVAVIERRPRRISGLRPGITIVTTPTCAICPAALSALRSHDRSILLYVLDASDPRALIVQATSAPTVVVADPSGREILRRTGRSTISDAARIVTTAQASSLAVGHGT